ncbi:MAG: carbohydrate binding family 9 domain-containing protein [Longimicrobiales bacterium]
MTRVFVVCLIAGIAAAPAAGRQAESSVSLADPYHGRLHQLDVPIPKSDASIRIDGVLNEAAWHGAAILTGFSQYQPVDGQAADDSTEVLVMYSDDAMLFGIRAFEPHGEVVVTLADRDRLDSNDHVQLLLDTFNDRRRALLFSVNALGVQSDGTFTDGAGTDLNPDFLFESKGRVTAYGYEVEVRIPFKSIRYQQTAVQSWGVQVLRRVMHSGHEQTWTPAERGQPSFLAQSGTFVGLTELRRGLVLDVNPVMTAHATGAPAAVGDGAWRYDRQDPEFGGTARWGVTPNLALSGTINPDFSQVEADVGQVVVDPRRALSFPEKRPFFLESSENFQVPNSLIYTRSIVAPEAAAKLIGKVGDFNVGVLSAVDDESLVADGTDHPIFNIVRLRRDLGEQSNFGLVYTDRMYGGDYSRLIGADTRMLLGTRYVLNAQLASSFTATSGATSHWKPLFDLALSRTGRETGFTFGVEGIHPEFRAASGFISRHGIAHANFTPRRTFFPENSVFESITFTPIVDGTWEWDRFIAGTFPNDFKLNTSTTALLRGGWQASLYTWTESFKYSPQLYKDYFIERRAADGAVLDTVPYVGTDRLPNYGGMLSVGTPQWRQFSGSIQVIAGHDDNFDEWSSAWISFVTLHADWRPTDRLRVSGRYLEQRFHRASDGSLVRLHTVPRIKLEYQLSRPIFFRFVGQYDALKVDALRDDSRTNDPILIRQADGTFSRAAAEERGGLRADWLFSYQPNPGTVVFAGYGASLGGDEFFRPSVLTRTSDGFFIKLSYLFRM